MKTLKATGVGHRLATNDVYLVTIECWEDEFVLTFGVDGDLPYSFHVLNSDKLLTLFGAKVRKPHRIYPVKIKGQTRFRRVSYLDCMAVAIPQDLKTDLSMWG